MIAASLISPALLVSRLPLPSSPICFSSIIRSLSPSVHSLPDYSLLPLTEDSHWQYRLDLLERDRLYRVPRSRQQNIRIVPDNVPTAYLSSLNCDSRCQMQPLFPCPVYEPF